MSSVKLQGNASGTGSITLASPNTNNDRTISLPDATTTMVGTDATQTLTNKTLTTPTIATIKSAASATPTVFQDSAGTEVGTLCRAWVNFNGTTSPGTVRASFNVSSVTRNGTGDYTINFTTALADANFAVTGTGEGNSANPGSNIGMISKRQDTAFTSTSARILCGESGSASAVPRDMSVISVAVFR